MTASATTTPPASAPKRGTVIKFAIGIAVSVAIVGYIIAKLDWHAFLAEFRAFNLWYLPILIALMLCVALVRAWRWQILLPSAQPVRLRDAFDATLLGFMANFLMPLRAGELVRPWTLSRWQPIPFTSALASIVVERFFDAFSLVVLLGVCLLRFDNAPPHVLAGARVIAISFLVLLVLMLVGYFLPGPIESAGRRATQRLFGQRAPKLAERLNRFLVGILGGFRGISSGRDLLAVLAISATHWLLMGVWYQVVLIGFGQSNTFWPGMLLNLMIAVAVAAPSAPGFVGTFQAGCILALSVMLGQSREFAMAYSIVAHVLQFLVVVLAGLVVLHLRGLSFASLRKEKTSSSG